MARGLSREQSKEKNLKKQQNAPKGNTENLTPAQRAERDKAAMAAKKAAKDAAKADLAQSADGAAQLAAEEKRKAEQRARQKEGSFAAKNPLLAKQLKKTGK
jgi:hypothetical protein